MLKQLNIQSIVLIELPTSNYERRIDEQRGDLAIFIR